MLFFLISEPQMAVRQAASDLSPGWVAFAVGSGIAAVGLAIGGLVRFVGYLFGGSERETPQDIQGIQKRGLVAKHGTGEQVLKRTQSSAGKPQLSHTKPVARDLSSDLEEARSEDLASMGSDYQDAQ